MKKVCLHRQMVLRQSYEILAHWGSRGTNKESPDLRKDVPKGRDRLADLKEYVLWKYYMRNRGGGNNSL